MKAVQCVASFCLLKGEKMVKVGIVMGSISDKPVMEECEKML